MENNNKEKRGNFTSKFGVIAAAAGSAIGLGNIWKFPYITGANGGAAFLFVYLAFIVLIGLPVMLSEFIIGRKAKKNAIGAFQKLAPKSLWGSIGVFGVGAAFIILSFYGVVAGWSIRYIFISFSEVFQTDAQSKATFFNAFITNPWQPIIYQFIFMFLTALIVVLGVQKGIERSSKIMMPLLLVIIIILDIRTLTLPGAGEGLKFLFAPDFSKLTFESILIALGHAFFSLSLGMGTLITYGSYIDKKNNLLNTAIQVTVADTVVSILAALAIIPAVFAFGLKPSEGPGLVFITLPNVFQHMPGGAFFAVIFFLLLAIAALTSSISILEVIVAYFTEELKLKRKAATIIAASLTSLLGIICSLSLGIYSGYTFAGLNVFDLMDFISANLLLPLGGMFIAIFIGWKLGRTNMARELAHGCELNPFYISGYMFLVRYLAPIAIFFVFVKGAKIIEGITSLIHWLF